jgi:hypothetical protein
MFGGPLALQPSTMRVNRLGLIPVSSTDPAVRRYRLARLEEVALQTPPEGRLADVRNIDAAMRAQRSERPGIRDRRAS